MTLIALSVTALQSLCELAKQAGNTSARGADHAAQQATIDSTHAEYGRG